MPWTQAARGVQWLAHCSLEMLLAGPGANILYPRAVWMERPSGAVAGVQAPSRIWRCGYVLAPPPSIVY